MRVLRDFRPEIANILQNVSEEIILKKLGEYVIFEKPQKPDGELSKWVRFAEEIDNDPDLDDFKFKKAWKQVKKDMGEIRKNFEFDHER